MIRQLAAVVLAVFCAAPLWADQTLDRLVKVLRLTDIIEVMHEEGLEYGDELDELMLGGQGGPFWAGEVRRLHDRDRILARVRKTLKSTLSNSEMTDSIRFFDNDRGQRLLALEIAARQAMSDPAVEEAAWEQFELLEASGSDRHVAILRFVEVNDLLERNVDGGLRSQFMFSLGLAKGGQSDWSRGEIAAETRLQEASIRETTHSWLMGFLTLAYGPVPQDDLNAYVRFSETPAGQALNDSLFEGFNGVYQDLSFGLGLAAGGIIASDDL
ncbi:DUF2059 domain-containing protein [Primorskyibacter sp. S87]|uniref:DUF2059 domain-containing protein n=1 Tax=Primorskyibacter sp. S87 TaxID=3415126 RepID=UPI003C7C28A9